MTMQHALAAGRLLFIMLLTACSMPPGTSLAADDGARRIVVVGDIHGDYDAYVRVLKGAGLIDDRLRWSGGEARLVQLGDVPDRGPDTRRILDHLMALERQAQRAGGGVVPLIGNHEAMNITGDLRYVTEAEFAAFRTRRSASLRDRFFEANREAYAAMLRAEEPSLTDRDVRARFDAAYPLGYIEHRRAWSPDGAYGGWVLENDTVRIIDGTLFVHGGISYAQIGRSPDEINNTVREALGGPDPDAAILTGPHSPLWYRGNTVDSPDSEAEVDAVLEAFGAERMVVGHTPSLEGIRSLFGGKVIVADTGMSEHYGGPKSFLVIEGNALTTVNDGSAAVLVPGAATP